MNPDFARQQMVDQQVRAWEVLDPEILEVMRTVPREQFVPCGFQSLAFADTEIPIGHGQSMMTPTLEGRVLQSLVLKKDERVLEIGTGTGFLTACMARLADRVTSVDIYDEFTSNAAATLEKCGIDNVELLTMDATKELPEGRFDAIAVTGSIQNFDPRFAMALEPGGRLFVIVGDPPVMEAQLVQKSSQNEWTSVDLFETRIEPLVNGRLPPQFSF